MNKRVTLAEAKAHISALVTEASAGAEITITRHGRPVARIVGAPTRAARTPDDWAWQGSYRRRNRPALRRANRLVVKRRRQR